MGRLKIAFAVMLFGTAMPLAASENFDLADGDRVILLGGTLIEREQQYAYWETVLTSRYPDRNILFRNLGWSGDTVFGEARAGFGTAADGFRRLKEHVHALKPTVILVAYGANESFEGEGGLPRFLEGLDVLLDTLAESKARIVLLAPLRHEDLGRPLPEPREHNRDLQHYAAAIRRVADKRGYRYLDLNGVFDQVSAKSHLTDNGIHLTAFGYWKTSFALADGLGQQVPSWQVEIDTEGKVLSAQGVKLSHGQASPLRFEALDRVLPPPPIPTAVAWSPDHATGRNGSSLVSIRDGVGQPSGTVGRPGHNARDERIARVKGLSPGKFALHIDGKRVAVASATEWQSGVPLRRGPEFDQAERLRAAIIEKNLLYFHRWRPQNETYLLGFRQHEQGKNAKEIVEFDPLVAAKEKEISLLRVPVPHRYEFIPQREADK